MLVFVGTLKQDDEIVQLEEGMHPYCASCRENLGISDELNAGRDLRAEARRVTLDSVAEARRIFDSGEGKGLDVIMDAIDNWIGGTDRLFTALGNRRPARPQEVFDGVSDAMNEVDPATMTPSQALALITVTHTVRDRIENWRGFVGRTHEHFKTVMGKARSQKNLAGFI